MDMDLNLFLSMGNIFLEVYDLLGLYLIHFMLVGLGM
jgi:hypothetical protein